MIGYFTSSVIVCSWRCDGYLNSLRPRLAKQANQLACTANTYQPLSANSTSFPQNASRQPMMFSLQLASSFDNLYDSRHTPAAPLLFLKQVFNNLLVQIAARLPKQQLSLFLQLHGVWREIYGKYGADVQLGHFSMQANNMHSVGLMLAFCLKSFLDQDIITYARTVLSILAGKVDDWQMRMMLKTRFLVSAVAWLC